MIQRENEGNVASIKALNDAYNVMYSVFPSEKEIVNPKERVGFMGTVKDPQGNPAEHGAESNRETVKHRVFAQHVSEETRSDRKKVSREQTNLTYRYRKCRKSLWGM